MKKGFICIFGILLLLFVSVSCVSVPSNDSVTGIWEYDDNSEKRVITLTSDGVYVYEEYSEDFLVYSQFGTYTDEENCLIIDSLFNEYSFDKNGNLVITLFDKTSTFRPVSRVVKNNTSTAKLKGVWKCDDGIVGITRSFVISMSFHGNSGNYVINDDKFIIEGDEYPFVIINNKLYLDDTMGFFGEGGIFVLSRKSNEGTDKTDANMLVDGSPWHLVTPGDDNYNYVYTFYSNGKYKLDYYNESGTDKGNSKGSYSFSGHTVSLSNDSDLAYAIIDVTPFMFTF